MAGVTPVSDGEESTKAASTTKDKPVQGDSESGEEEGTEYEIERVLDAKRGYFPDGRMGYFVKWKGYGENENSWVDELDAVNAVDLVDEYWARNPKKKAASRKSIDKKSPKKPRKSGAADDSSDAGQTSTKKRGRKPSTKNVESGDEMDVDVEPRAPKKAKRASTQATKATKTKTATPEPEEKTIGTMDSYMHMKGWDGLVKTVDTVERGADDVLVVYFTLQSGEAVVAPSKICNQRFPEKMLEFYESNLRWRSIEEKESP